MTDWSTRRIEMPAVLEPSLGAELVLVFDQLLSDRPWRRPEVRDAIAAHGRDRRHLHGTLIEVIGETHAGTLMEYLVPAPWTVLEDLGVPVADLLAAPTAA